MRQEKFLYSFVVAAALLWCFAILAAPLLAGSSGMLLSSSEVIYQFFGRICHQIDSRSFHLGGNKFAVCARCSSIYFGFLVGLLSMLFVRRFPSIPFPPRWVLLVSTFPMLLDVGLAFLNIHESSLWTMGISGGLFGLTVAYFIYPGFREAICSWALPIPEAIEASRDKHSLRTDSRNAVNS